MRTARQQFVAMIVAVALGFVLLSGFGASPAHAAAGPNKAKGNVPDSCFWFADASQSKDVYGTNGQPAGYYEVVEQHYSCITSWHRAYGVITITSSSFSCTRPTFYVNLYANYVNVEGVSVVNGSAIGGSGSSCPGGTSYSLTTSTYINSSFVYCAEMTGINFGGSLSDLKAGSDCP